MPSIAIDRRFRGPPMSANGGYVCGLVANAIGGSGEVTLRAPPPLDQPLEIVQGADGSVELRNAQTLLATGRQARVDVAEIPVASFAEAEDAASRSLYSDERNSWSSGLLRLRSRARAGGRPEDLRRPAGGKPKPQNRGGRCRMGAERRSRRQ